MRRRFVHVARHRQIPHLRNPRTFNEKISWRIINDRRDLLKFTCDKLAMKNFALAQAGDMLRVPRTLWSGYEVAELGKIALPPYWVLKPNHRSGLVYFGQGAVTDAEKLNCETEGWLSEENWRIRGEWAYQFAAPVLLAEEHIGLPGIPPVDYKFEVFGGKVKMVAVYPGRLDGIRGYFFDRKFSPIQARYAVDKLRKSDVLERPPNFDTMVTAAEKIGAAFDYIRIDLYDTGDAVWFGETTPYSGSGVNGFKPKSFDRELGSYWKLPDL